MAKKQGTPKKPEVNSKPIEATKVKVVAPKKKEIKYSHQAYCNLVGSNRGERFVAKLKFKKEGKKTAKDWKEMFLEIGLSV